MTAPTHSLSSPLSTSSKALVRFKGVDSTSSEATEKPASESISEQAKNAVDLVDFDSSTPTFASDPNDNARDTGLVSRAVDLVVFESEATKNDQSDPSSTVPEPLRLLGLVGTDDDPYQDGGPWAYANDPGGRVFMITQNLEHPSTGQTLITTEQVEKAVSKKGVKQYAWILHDKDVYTAAEVAKNPALVQGSPKAPHIHVAIQRSSFASIAQVARAFGVPPQCVEPKPPSAFLDLVEYLTHENPKQQQAGKHLYDDSEVHAPKGWDWRSDLEEHKEKRLEKGLSKSLKRRKKEAALNITLGKWDLEDVYSNDPELWSMDGVMKHLKALRADWLTRQTPPGQVLNIYICGDGGSGKDVMASVLARCFNPGAKRPYFSLGGANVSFEHYDGEEVIIWEDFRAYQMLEACRQDRGLLFRILGPYRDVYKKLIVNIKGSDTQLLNRVNIITGPDPYDVFLDGLAGEYKAYSKESGQVYQRKSENKAQSYRRFPLIIPMSEGEFSIYLNKGFLEGTREYFEYEKYEHFRQDLGLLKRRCEQIRDRDRAAEIELTVGKQTAAPILEQYPRLTGELWESVEPDAVLAEFSSAGQPIVEPEPTPEEIEARKKAEEEAARKAEEDARKAEEKAVQAAAEYKAAEEQRKAAELARKQREQEVIDAKKAELAAAGEIRLLSSVQVKWVNDEPRAVVPSSSSPEQTSPWWVP
mgnify:CR=1 FL=1